MSDELPPHKAWDRLVEGALDDEVERVKKLTPEELDRDLAAKGLDPAAVRAKGEAFAARFKAAAAAKAEATESLARAAGPAKPKEAPLPAPVIPLRAAEPPARRWNNVAWLAAVAVAAAVLLVLLRHPGAPDDHVALHDEASTPAVSASPTAPSPQQLAAVARLKGLAACDAKQWYDCQAKLDEAWRLDPEGEDDPRIAHARSVAKEAIQEQLRIQNAKQ